MAYVPRDSDDLGTNTLPPEWPPRHEFLTQFFFAPSRQEAGKREEKMTLESHQGVSYRRSGRVNPQPDDKLMAGIMEEEKGCSLVRWASARYVGNNQATFEGSGSPEDLPEVILIESDYKTFIETAFALSDYETKDDEDLSLELMKEMRGEAKQPRKPWGAVRQGKKSTARSLPKRVVVFDPNEAIGLHLNSETMEVVRVDSFSQSRNVRVGWRLTSVDGKPTRGMHDLKEATRAVRGGSTTWAFEVPNTYSAGPPLAILSAQAVILCGEHNEACRRVACPHQPKLAFRLDPNHRYIGLDGRAVEPALKYFPEGAAKTELDQEGEFPQNGHRVPMFGEPVEAIKAAHVHISSIRETVFPDSLHRSRLTESHGAIPDPMPQPLDNSSRSFNQASLGERRLGASMEHQRKRYEEMILQRERELEALKKDDLTLLKASCTQKVDVAERQASFFKRQAESLQRQLVESIKRSASRMARDASDAATNSDIAPTQGFPHTDVLGESEPSKAEPPLPPAPDKNSTQRAEAPKGEKNGWWNELHARNAARLGKREQQRLIGEALRLQREVDSLPPPPPPPPHVTWRNREVLARKVSEKGDHLERGAELVRRRAARADASNAATHREDLKCCEQCGFPCKPAARTNDPRVAKGMRVEARRGGADSPFVEGCVVSVRSTGSCDIRFDGPDGTDAGIEVNVSRDLIRPQSAHRCMCTVRGTLGYKVVARKSDAALDSTSVYKSSDTALGKTWQAMDLEDTERRKTQQANISQQDTSLSAAFAARQKAWDDERLAKREVLREELESEVKKRATENKPKLTVATKAGPTKVALKAEAVCKVTTGASTALIDDISRKRPEREGIASAGMEGRWEAEARLKIERQLLSLGYKKVQIATVVSDLWTKAFPLGLVMPLKKKMSTSDRVFTRAHDELQRLIPGPEWVDGEVRVLEGSGCAGMLGHVKSFDPVKCRFVVDLEDRRLVALKGDQLKLELTARQVKLRSAARSDAGGSQEPSGVVAERPKIYMTAASKALLLKRQEDAAEEEKEKARKKQRETRGKILGNALSEKVRAVRAIELLLASAVAKASDPKTDSEVARLTVELKDLKDKKQGVYADIIRGKVRP